MIVRESEYANRIKVGDYVRMRYYHDMGGNPKPFLITRLDVKLYDMPEKQVGRGKNKKMVIVPGKHARKEIWLTCLAAEGTVLRYPDCQILEIVKRKPAKREVPNG